MAVTNSLDLLQCDVRTLVKVALTRLDRLGIKVIITETLRTKEVQQAYYAQGRESLEEVNRLRKIAGMAPTNAGEARREITKADGVRHPSNHQSGRAVDLFPANGSGGIWWGADQSEAGRAVFFRIAEVFKELGFTWGGDWKEKDSKAPIGWDAPHFELP